jgi:hypothetical protein
METWLVDSGASRHMTRSHKSLTILIEKNSWLQVELGDNTKYVKYGKPLKMSDVLYVPGLKKNLLSISSMEDRRYVVAFVGGQVISWTKGSSFDSTKFIGARDGSLYRLIGQPTQALVHENDSPCELWYRGLGHLHHWALPILWKMVTSLP